MTVIAAYDHYGCKAIITDILITGPRSPNGEQSIIPTQGDVSDFFGDDWGIQTPTQKLSLIENYCAIAWAGKVIVAQYFIKRIRKISRRVRLSKSIIERIFNKSGAQGAISIVAALIEDGNLIHFGIECETISSANLGNVFFSGTGEDAIRDYDKIVKISRPPIQDLPAQTTSICLTQVAHLMHAEARQGDASHSLRDCFGGGYEIAVFYGGGVHKISANFVFIEFEIIEGYIELSHPYMIIHQNYDGETLVFESIRLSPEEAIEAHHKIQVNDFIGRENDDSRQIRESQNWACFVFYEKNKSKHEENLISTAIRSDDVPFSFDTEDNRVRYFYSEGAEAHIKEFLISNI